MIISTRSVNKNDICKFVLEHGALFNNFDNVILFGSCLKEIMNPNDIDLLLIYKQYSQKTANSTKLICRAIENEFHISADLTSLSVAELKETEFLKKIVNYYKIK